MRRTPYQAIAAILIITQTFFVISLFTFVIFGSSKIISYFESRPQVAAFFYDEAKQENIDKLAQSIKETGKVAEIKFVSKEQALKVYREQNKNDPLLLDLVTASILPASLEISAVNIQDLSSISEILKKSSLVKQVVFQEDIVSTLTDWTNAIRKIGVVLVTVLALDSVMIMVIIIGIKISQRREEIEIMRLLGATNWYIRLPFIYEGMIYGIMGAFVGWLLSSAILLYATPLLSEFLKGVPLFPIPFLFFVELLGLELVLAILLGFFASFTAVLRYLK